MSDTSNRTLKHLYLMIKTHNVTGLKYLCKKVTTSESKAISYLGSGTRWQNHLKFHGKNISTEILAKYELCRLEEFSKLCIEYSTKFDIVNNIKWANLIIETGKPGTKIDKYCGDKGTFFGKTHTKETKEKISMANRGDNNVMRRRPEVLLKLIETRNRSEYRERQKINAIVINNRPDVKEKQRSSKLGIKNPASDKRIYQFFNKLTGDVICGTRYELVEQSTQLSMLNNNINPIFLNDFYSLFKKNTKSKSIRGWYPIFKEDKI